jgi:hypothetical protein
LPIAFLARISLTLSAAARPVYFIALGQCLDVLFKYAAVRRPACASYPRPRNGLLTRLATKLCEKRV